MTSSKFQTVEFLNSGRVRTSSLSLFTHDLHVDVESGPKLLLDLHVIRSFVDNLDNVARSQILITQLRNRPISSILCSESTALSVPSTWALSYETFRSACSTTVVFAISVAVFLTATPSLRSSQLSTSRPWRSSPSPCFGQGTHLIVQQAYECKPHAKTTRSMDIGRSTRAQQM